MTNKPEILSPAGNYEKLVFAVDYGADAVYCALDSFGMRAAADNFTPGQLAAGIEYAHKKGVKVYLAMNASLRGEEFGKLKDYLAFLDKNKPDAFIVADCGIIEYIREYISDPVLHLSTQANTMNSAACRFWHKNGIKRIVLSRELALADIIKIRAETPRTLELECFVHGAMCVSYSGRCLLSNYYTGRNANSGECAQPCRWKYFLYEENRVSDLLEAVGEPEGTYLFSSRDLCMIEHIPQLVSAGINSFKIEGRMKSVYYTAALTNAYRVALDKYFESPENYFSDPAYKRETESVSHREYGTGYFFSDPRSDANVAGNNEYLTDKAFLCTVSEFFPDKKLARCVQRNKISTGDKANILSPGTFGKNFTVGEMFSADMVPIASAPHARMEFFISIDKAEPNDIIRKALNG